MNHLKVALLQIAPTGTLEGNMAKGMDACRDALWNGGCFVLLECTLGIYVVWKIYKNTLLRHS